MKTYIKILTLITGISFFTGCCLQKTHFTAEEMQWLYPYEEGDILIFQSENGDLDTTLIVMKTIYHARCYYSSYRRNVGRIYYQNNNTQNEKIGVTLLHIFKRPDYTWLSIRYSETIFIIRDFDDLNSYKIAEKEYRFHNYYNTSLDKIAYLYWHKDYGIIKYITHDGVEWKRINLDYEFE